MSVSFDSASPEVTLLVGHPRHASRTAGVGATVAGRLAGPSTPRELGLAELGLAGLAQGGDDVREIERAVCATEVLVVATPVFKASYPGLLKVFLERLDVNALDGVVVVPVVLGASSAHGTLADQQLRVVLQAVGAVLPVPSFVLEEHHLDDLEQYVDVWARRFGPVVTAVTQALHRIAVVAQ